MSKRLLDKTRLTDNYVNDRVRWCLQAHAAGEHQQLDACGVGLLGYAAERATQAGWSSNHISILRGHTAVKETTVVKYQQHMQQLLIPHVDRLVAVFGCPIPVTDVETLLVAADWLEEAGATYKVEAHDPRTRAEYLAGVPAPPDVDVPACWLLRVIAKTV